MDTTSVDGSRRSVRLVIVGDVLLDRDIAGNADRVAPDGAALVVGSLRYDVSPGGAGLAACTAAADGHRVTLISALSEDDEARQLTEALAAAGVAFINLGTSSRTAVKTRIRAERQTVLMLDHATPPAQPGPLPAAGLAALRDAQAVLVSDYGRGAVAAPGVRAALCSLVDRVPLVWDPHPNGAVPVPGTSVVTPNSRETRHFIRDITEPELRGDVLRARRLRREWSVDCVAVTRGRDGVAIIRADDVPPLVLQPPSVAFGDSRGAGDRLASAAAALLGSGVDLAPALAGAVEAAARMVDSANARTTDRLRPALGNESAAALSARVRGEGGTVVATAGCFDLLHRGHVWLLEHARALGDCLIVCLNSDASVTRIKGDTRPLVGVDDRAEVLTALSCVDAVAVFDEQTPAEILSSLRPHVYVKGADYALSDISERVVVEGCGGVVVLVPVLKGHSSTSLIESARRRGGQR